MTTYTTISGALVAVGAKPFATTIQALRDNPIAIGEADASVPASLLPTVLLGTLTTTSGASQTLSGLVLTPYKKLMIEVDGVSSSINPASLYIVSSSLIIGAANSTASNAWYGVFDLLLSSGIISGQSSVQNPAAPPIGLATLTNYMKRTGYSTATTSITFGVTAGSFDAGSIKVYGCK
jgi:hypothetical protein